MLPKRVLSARSDSSGTDEMVRACNIMVTELNGLQAKKPLRPCRMPGVYLLQMFPVNVTHILSYMFVNPFSVEKKRQYSMESEVI